MTHRHYVNQAPLEGCRLAGEASSAKGIECPYLAEGLIIGAHVQGIYLVHSCYVNIPRIDNSLQGGIEIQRQSYIEPFLHILGQGVASTRIL